MFQDEEQKAQLKCRVINRGDPYFNLHPVKFEEISHDPNISLIHEVITDNEIEQVKKIAKAKVR